MVGVKGARSGRGQGEVGVRGGSGLDEGGLG